MADADKCVCCGTIIPEGSHVCPNCKVAVNRDDRMDAYAYLAKYLMEVNKEKQTKRSKKSKPTIKVVLDEGAKKRDHWTTSKKVSGRFGSKDSLAHMRVTRSSVSDRLMMLWV